MKKSPALNDKLIFSIFCLFPLKHFQKASKPSPTMHPLTFKNICAQEQSCSSHPRLSNGKQGKKQSKKQSHTTVLIQVQILKEITQGSFPNDKTAYLSGSKKQRLE